MDIKFRFTPHEHRNLTSSICHECGVNPNENHAVACSQYGLWDTEYYLEEFDNIKPPAQKHPHKPTV